MKYVVIFPKRQLFSRHPLSFKWHGWIVDADGTEQALELLEVRSDVPWKRFCHAIIPFDDLGSYRTEQLEGEQVLLHT
jgi:hypothetical protein